MRQIAGLTSANRGQNINMLISHVHKCVSGYIVIAWTVNITFDLLNLKRKPKNEEHTKRNRMIECKH